MLTFHIITLFPGAFGSYFKESIIARAIKTKKIKIKFYNPRDFVAGPRDGYRRVDRKAYGGGPGMVLEALPILKAVERALANTPRAKIILFSPGGKPFTNQKGIKLAKKHRDIILICGRYEGVDARVKKILKAEEISVGPYVLTGGELPAMAVIDSTARQIEGVLGKLGSLEERRVAASEVYTRPEVFRYKGRDYRVPKILLSGHHAEINKWKLKQKIKH